MSTTISGTNGVTFPDSTSMQTGQQACKAWVNFNGQGTVAIREAYNVSSITDNGAGDYTVNFTNAMVDANYSSTSGLGYISGEASYGFMHIPWTDAPTTTAIRLACLNYNSGSQFDHTYVSVAVFSN